MKRNLSLFTAVFLSAAPFARAQQTATQPEPVRVQIEVQRSRAGGPLVDTRRFTIATALDAPAMSLNHGRELPVGDAHRNVGTNLQSRVKRSGDSYVVWLALELSSLAADGDAPAFDTFHVTGELSLRAGESTQWIDTETPGTDERVSVNVTLEK